MFVGKCHKSSFFCLEGYIVSSLRQGSKCSNLSHRLCVGARYRFGMALYIIAPTAQERLVARRVVAMWCGSEPLVNLCLGMTAPIARQVRGRPSAQPGGRASLSSCRRAFRGAPSSCPRLRPLRPFPRFVRGPPAPRASAQVVPSGARPRVLTTPTLIAQHKKRLMPTFMTFPQIIDARELKIISHAAPYR